MDRKVPSTIRSSLFPFETNGSISILVLKNRKYGLPLQVDEKLFLLYLELYK
jgi:hypothetical protein